MRTPEAAKKHRDAILRGHALTKEARRAREMDIQSSTEPLNVLAAKYNITITRVHQLRVRQMRREQAEARSAC